jgi:hypothetical protein
MTLVRWEAKAEGEQQRSIGEWERLCRDSQTRADQARAARRRWPEWLTRLLVAVLLASWTVIVALAVMHLVR